MALWLVRAGKHGEHEQRFFTSDRIYLTFDELRDLDLRKAADHGSIRKLSETVLPGGSTARISNFTGQVHAFVLGMQPGDWIALPLKTKPAIAFAEIEGPYRFEPKADPPYRHSRSVRWLHREVPRSLFGQDLLYSFGAFMSVCQVERNDAERRVKAMAAAGWTQPDGARTAATVADGPDQVDVAEEQIDLERLSNDQIAKLIARRYKGHGMARLVDAVLRAQGYSTHVSPVGADKGVDILAAPGPLGFGRPRICVQVKSQDSPVDRPTLDQLIGAMQNVQADQGLLVSWGGFRTSVDREVPAQFFRVRLWDQDDLIRELLAQYERLDEDLRAELPLKRIWAVASQDEEG